MFYGVLLWGVWLELLLHAGSSAEGKPPKEVIGVLGESATFLLGNPSSFDKVLWFRNEIQLAILTWGPPCQLRPLDAYEGRDVTVSQDCLSLTVRGLRKEDAAGYKAQMMNNDYVTIETQIFTLKAYKRFSVDDLQVVCTKDPTGGNMTLHLNCSVGNWDKGVEFSWTPFGQSDKVSSSGWSLLVLGNPQDEDQNVTCTAENAVSNASRTVSLKQTCAAREQTTGRPPTASSPGNPDRHISSGAKAGIIVLMLLVIVAMAAAIWKCRMNRTASRKELISPSSNSGPKDCKSVYAEIQIVPQDVESETPLPRKGPKACKEVPVTIYADVQHPDKTPLETDDEKMRREKRRVAAKSEKSIYSEISDRKENPEEKLKTIYDTVNHSRPPEATEYNKIL